MATPALAVAVTVVSALTVPAALSAQDGPPEPLSTVRNFQQISDRLASAGQIGYDQIPLLRRDGYQVVVNLAVADQDRNAEEGFRVAREGLTYIHIPVEWENPTLDDVQEFLDVMRANQDRKVFVHCFANMRASAFVYLYRTLVEGVPEEEARATMNQVWDPGEVAPWARIIRQARAAGGR